MFSSVTAPHTHRRFTSLWAMKGTDVMTPTHDKLAVGT